MNTRRYDIDWLRVLAMVGVFLFHVSCFFDNEDWHLKASLAQQSEVMTIVRGTFVWVWLMELFFLLSGFAAFYALKNRTAKRFLVDRVKRLLIPLYTVGMFVLLVPQAYFERFSHGQTTLSFWQWLPAYFRGLPAEMVSSIHPLDPVNVLPLGFDGHLWFLIMLFLISVISLPLLQTLKSEKGQQQVAKWAGWATKPGGIFLFILPLAVVRIAFNWLPMTTERTWGDFLWYALFFLFGYILAGDTRFSEGIKKAGWLSLGLWLVLFIGVGSLLQFVLEFNTDSGNGFSLLFVVWQITYSIASWCSVVFLLSLGARYLNFTNKFLVYSNEAVLPFYIFHQTIILIVGWFVIPWEMSGLLKYIIIAAISFPLIVLLYEVFVRRFNFMRFLFGMPLKKKRVAVPQKVPTSAG